MIRRPLADDLRERKIVRAVRSAAGPANTAARGSLTLGRALFVFLALPLLGLPAVMAFGFSIGPGWLQLACIYAALFGLGALAWVWGFKAEWRGRLTRRANRLSDLEDTSALRMRSLDRVEPPSGAA